MPPAPFLSSPGDADEPDGSALPAAEGADPEEDRDGPAGLGLDSPRPRCHGIQQPGRHLPGLRPSASITLQSKQHTRPPLHIT